MSSPLSAARVLRCTYRWSRRGCKSQHCLYYWSSLWPWVEAASTHTAFVRAYRGLPSTSAQHGGGQGGAGRRDVMQYTPQPHQSFPAQYYISRLSAYRGMTTKSNASKHVLDTNEDNVLGKTTVKDHKQNEKCLSTQPEDQSKNTKEEKAVEAPKVDDGSTVIPESLTKDVNRTVTSSTHGNEQLPSRVQRYFLWRYSWYLRNFHQSLKNEMPDTFHMLHIFTVGLKEFMYDFKDLIKILVFLSLPGSTLASLSRHELDVYYRMPGDMVRVFPVLLLSSLPFGQNIAFPVGYWFPRHLLCHHFWDIKQRHEFAVMGLKKRLYNARPVFRCLQSTLFKLDEEDKDRCITLFHKIGSGIHPSVDEIVDLIPLFQGQPFHLNKIGARHVNALLRLHGRSVWWLRRQRLRDHARILHCMDAAISREGIDSLTLDNLKAILVFRGLNPTNMSTAVMLEFLQNWLSVSREIDGSSYSLLLHLPIFLAYNQPSNFVLIYS